MRTLTGPSDPDLDDLVQAAAEQVLRSQASFEGRSEFTTWVYAVCYRVLLGHRRWRRRWSSRFLLAGAAQEPKGPNETPAAIFEERERADCLRRNLAKMSDKYRAVVVLHDFEELDIAEIVSIVGANERTVRSRLRDGRKQLLRLLKADPTFLGLGGLNETATE